MSGPLSERTGQFWPITLVGYVVQMSAVPLLAIAPNWQTAGALIVAEHAVDDARDLRALGSEADDVGDRGAGGQHAQGVTVGVEVVERVVERGGAGEHVAQPGRCVKPQSLRQIRLASILLVELLRSFQRIGVLAKLFTNRRRACRQRPCRWCAIEVALARHRPLAADVEGGDTEEDHGSSVPERPPR